MILIQYINQSYLIIRFDQRGSESIAGWKPFILRFNLINIMSGQRKRIGKYIVFLSNKLGAGAFSEVYLGLDDETKEQVAVKVVRKDIINQDEYTKNAFYSQIHISKKLRSPNVIKFYDVHETANNFYVILQLASSGNLRLLFKQARSFDEPTTMRHLIMILNGMGELIKHGITHRDLKPQNILLSGGVLKIADFGFAKISESIAGYSSIVGTPIYMAPQIMNEQRYSYKCDIWSLGVMTYEMMVGKVPWSFKERNLTSLLKQIVSTKISFPSDLKISQNMKDFIVGCLQIDEQNRYSWEQVFLHNLFQDKFKNSFGHKPAGTQIGFIMSDLRLSLHSKNINLSKILAKYGDKLTHAQLSSLIGLIDNQIAPGQVNMLYTYLTSKDSYVYTEEFVKFMLKHQCRMQGINLSRLSQMGSTMLASKPGISILVKLKTIFDSDVYDLRSFLQSQGYSHRDSLNLITFGDMIGKLEPNVTEIELRYLYNQLNGNSNKVLTFGQVCRGLCKIAEIVPFDTE